MKFPSDKWQKARIVYRAMTGMNDVGVRREFLAKEVVISERLADQMLAALDNLALISGTAETIEAGVEDTELIMADLHIPFHCDDSVDKAIDEAVKHHNITIVSLLGDVMDMYRSSFFRRNPLKGSSVKQELEQTREILERIRSAFPQARIIYLEGNHERRFMSKIDSVYPEAHDLMENLLQNKLGLDELGIEYRQDKYKIGALFHIHGDELRLSGGAVNIAKLCVDRTNKNIVTAHYHTVQEYIKKCINEETIGGWSIGHLATPEAFRDYKPVNNWVKGFAIVKYLDNGKFRFHNHKILNGEIY